MSYDPDTGRYPSPWSPPRPTPLPLSNGSPSSPADSGLAEPVRKNSDQAVVQTPGERQTDRPSLPTRSSTLGPPDKPANRDAMAHSKSDDLNHNGSWTRSNNTSAGGSRPSTPSRSMQPSTSDLSMKRSSVTSLHSTLSEGSSSSHAPRPPPSTTSTSNVQSASCYACGKAMQGPFVRALGTVYHLNCFKCMDCSEIVASKFFPIEGSDGKQHPLCERDYFRRLNLICAKCNMALRGSYITACNKKFHVEHFTCSICTTLFGPQDSYYEHEGDVYCHFHYSTRFATKCAGCNSAILKQFVEINRNMRDECWHPECYMINKFWNVKVVSRRPLSIEGEEEEPVYAEDERSQTPGTLKDRQVRMEQQVYRIWTVLSAFEESSAACISDMLRQVSNGQYIDAIRMAEKFILHVEVLFATIDDLEYHFYQLSMKGMSHVREARMLCRKTVELFTLLSHTQETGSRRMGMTQELLALVTGLAHYLKILIRIALTGALKLEREHIAKEAMGSFLDKLHLLAVQGGNPSARRVIKGQHGEALNHSQRSNLGTQGVTYGFRSLAPENAGESPFNASSAQAAKISANHPPSDLCVKCNQTVEEDCVRLGTYQRWHSQCIQCAVCARTAAVPLAKEQAQIKNGDDQEGKPNGPPKVSNARRPPANVGLFTYDTDTMKETASFGEVPTVILCTDHAHGKCRGGFQAVQRLEQYSFLLNVALRRLYLLLRKQGVVPLTPDIVPNNATPVPSGSEDPYRNSGDIMRMKSVHLDRKLSATARLPKRSTIVESPAGRSVAPSDGIQAQRSQDVSAVHQTHTQQPHHPYHPQYAQTQVARTTTPQQRPQLVPPDSQVLRPSFARNNTEVKIVDESQPSSPALGDDSPMEEEVQGEGITLADIPQIMEAAQAREQQRSLPRQSASPFIAELTALELTIVKYSALLVLLRSPLREQFDHDEIIELVEMKKGGFWNKLFKAEKKNIKKKGVFGVPLELLVEREGSDSLLGATRATLRVPSFVDDVVLAMRQMDMSVEGIFRKNGNIRRIKEYAESLDRDPSSVDLSLENPVQLAALLKKFLRELPDPLMTFKLHRLFVATQSIHSEEERKRMLHMICIIMPKSHRDTMEVLFVFLKWVASFAHMDETTGSKMDLGNLSTVIAPSILYSRGSSPQHSESFVPIRVITEMLEQQDLFFTVPEEFLSILHDQNLFMNSLDLPGKEFLKKCETYQRLRGSGARPMASNIASYNGGQNGNGPRHNGAPSTSPNQDHSASPMPIAAPVPDRSNRPYPAPAPYSSSSPAIPSAAPLSPRLPHDEWPPTRPQMSQQGNSSSSRPTSWVQPRPSTDQQHPYAPPAPPTPDMYQAVRQRT